MGMMYKEDLFHEKEKMESIRTNKRITDHYDATGDRYINQHSKYDMTSSAFCKQKEEDEELEKIKIHPRDLAVNEALISRTSAAYANALGGQRKEIGFLLSEFETVLRSYDKRAIEEARRKLEEYLNAVEGSGVFD